MSVVVRIPDHIYSRLKVLAEPFTDSPASVIERLLDFREKYIGTSGASFADEVLPDGPKVPNSDVNRTTDAASRGRVPDTLEQVLMVCDLVWDHRRSYQEAVSAVAKELDIEPNTVRDKCTRLLSIRGAVKVDTSLFLEMLDQRDRMREHLLRKFPRHRDLIHRRLGNVASQVTTS